MVSRIKTGVPEVDRVLDRLCTDVDKLAETGVLLASQVVAATPYRFVHGLGRPWRGWIQTRSDSPDKLYEVNVTTTNRAKEIWLQCASNSSVEIYLY